VNDGDKDTPGQKGWSGWGPHMIVFGKTAPDAALVTLTAAEVLASFETDFSDGEIPETAELFGTAEIGPDELDEADEPNEFLHVTDAINSQNGSMKIQDITDGRTFKEFEVGFRLYISDSTCCGSDDDWSPAHRPADGWSLSIGNELPDTIGLPEEGTGTVFESVLTHGTVVGERLLPLTCGMELKEKWAMEIRTHGAEVCLFAKSLMV